MALLLSSQSFCSRMIKHFKRAILLEHLCLRINNEVANMRYNRVYFFTECLSIYKLAWSQPGRGGGLPGWILLIMGRFRRLMGYGLIETGQQSVIGVARCCLVWGGKLLTCVQVPTPHLLSPLGDILGTGPVWHALCSRGRQASPTLWSRLAALIQVAATPCCKSCLRCSLRRSAHGTRKSRRTSYLTLANKSTFLNRKHLNTITEWGVREK